LNPGRRGGKPATNRLSYGAAQTVSLLTYNISAVRYWHLEQSGVLCFFSQRIFKKIIRIKLYFAEIATATAGMTAATYSAY
jgi:hypothetical protein